MDLHELQSRMRECEARSLAAEDRVAGAIAGFEARVLDMENSAAARSQDAEARILALETQSVAAKKEAADVRAALLASQEQVATLRRALRELPPSQAAEATPPDRRYAFASRGLTLAALPDELLRSIVEHLVPDWQAVIQCALNPKDVRSLLALSCTSKGVRIHTIPFVMQNIYLFSLDDVRRLTTAVLEHGYGRYIRSLCWRPIDGNHGTSTGSYSMHIIRTILLLVHQAKAEVTSGSLTESFALPEHLTSASLDAGDQYNETVSSPAASLPITLTFCQLIHFELQVLAIILRSTPALENLSLSSFTIQLLNTVVLPPLLELKSLDIDLWVGPSNDLAQMPAMSMLRETFGALPTLHMLAVQGIYKGGLSLFDPRSTWPQIRSLCVEYGHTKAAAACVTSDSNVPVPVWVGWQRLCDCVPNLRCLKIMDEFDKEQQAEAHVLDPPPLEVLPHVRFPETLQVLRLEYSGTHWRLGEFAAAVSHCESLRALYCDTEDGFSLAKLPPSLTAIHVHLYDDVIGSTLHSLLDLLQSGHCPKNLAELSLEGSSFRFFTTLMNLLGRLQDRHQLGGDLDIETLLATLRLNDACRERGVVLTRESVPFVTASFYEALPYLLLCDMTNKAAFQSFLAEHNSTGGV